jgi:hypothetical protein
VEQEKLVLRPGWLRRVARPTSAVVSVLTTALVGCSFAMQGPDPNWDGKKKPDCAESYSPVIMDAFVAIGLAGGAVELATNQNVQRPAELTIAMFAVSLLYTVSAGSGAGKYRECRTATASWLAREAIRERDEAAAADGVPAQESRIPGSMAAQLGVTIASTRYFCVRSPSRAELEICTRERSRCEHVRDLMGLPSRDECAPHDAAWCLVASGAERCFATESACEARLIAASGGASECSARR